MSHKTTGIFTVRLRVLIHSAEEGGFWAEIPALPGCVSEGESVADALANIRLAAAGWLEVAGGRNSDDQNAQLAEIEL